MAEAHVLPEVRGQESEVGDVVGSSEGKGTSEVVQVLGMDLEVVDEILGLGEIDIRIILGVGCYFFVYLSARSLHPKGRYSAKRKF